MYETPEDLHALQQLLDASYEWAGEHLLSIHTPERRLSAQQLSEELHGMCLLTLATTTRDGRPISGPVDGLFYRGKFWFGSGMASLRFRHIRQRPHVSATHLPGEELAVSVHGTATEVDLDAPEHLGFRDYCVEIYGDDWFDWGAESPYARIDPTRMFAVRIVPDEPGSADLP